jgi:hypothetical protein
MLRRSVFIAAILFLFVSGCMPAGSIHKVVKHPGLDSGEPVGYIELWAPTSFGMWMKDLEEGPTACDTYYVRQSGMEKGELLGITKVLEWPGTLGSLKNRPIADNFSATRFAMPAGKHKLFIAAGQICYPYDMDDELVKGGYAVPGGVSGKVYSLPLYPIDVEVEPDAIRLYKVALRKDEEGFYISLQWSDTLLPVPENQKKLDPDPNSYDALVDMLDDDDWGFRWYAAKRIRFIGGSSTVPIIQERLKVEEHKDVRNELEKALKKLGE